MRIIIIYFFGAATDATLACKLAYENLGQWLPTILARSRNGNDPFLKCIMDLNSFLLIGDDGR